MNRREFLKFTILSTIGLVIPSSSVFPLEQELILFKPLKGNFRITQKFKSNYSHPGIDWDTPMGTPVYHSIDGTVFFADIDPSTNGDPKTGYGLCVFVQGKDFSCIYGHLAQICCQREDIVKSGHLLGFTGNSGYSSGPHLHFEARTGLSMSTAIDPLPYLKDIPLSNEVLFQSQVISKIANRRSGPGTQYPITGVYNAGDIFEVKYVAGNDYWFQDKDGNWIAGFYYGTKYSEII